MLADRGIYFLESFVLGPAISFWFVSLQSVHIALSVCFWLGTDTSVQAFPSPLWLRVHLLEAVPARRQFLFVFFYCFFFNGSLQMAGYRRSPPHTL